MNVNIQQIIDNSKLNDTICFPSGEFEGPFFIYKSCNIIGTSTTLWAKKGPVLFIESNNVSIKNIRIEITEEAINPNDFICLKSKFKDTKYDNIEIIGNVLGIPNEEDYWDLPKVISLGEIPSQTYTNFIVEVSVPTNVKIYSNIDGVSITPSDLSSGKNILNIKIEKMKENTFLYGEILFESIFIRRMYISASVKNYLKNYTNNKIIYKLNNAFNLQQNNLSSSSKIIAPMDSNPNIINLKRGQRISIKDIITSKIQIIFSFSKMVRPMEVDPYVFLLDNNKANNDENLIFFGNNISKDNSVRYIEKENEKMIEIDFKNVSYQIQSIAVAYSIYGDNPSNNFSKIISPTIRILSDSLEKLRFSPQDLLIETTIVAVEFYRYKNEWKINTIGSGYRDGLKRLCESYGLTVL